MFNLLAHYLIAKAQRTPYFHLEGYMERFWLVPYSFMPVSFWKRPIAWVLQKFGIAIRVHHILRADIDRHMHDHPWSFLSLVLDGWYVEKRPRFNKALFLVWGEELSDKSRRDTGSWAYRKATDRHNVSLVSDGGVWTLFITFRKKQTWGFYTPKGKIAYPEYEQHGVDGEVMAVYSEKTNRYEEQ